MPICRTHNGRTPLPPCLPPDNLRSSERPKKTECLRLDVNGESYHQRMVRLAVTEDADSLLDVLYRRHEKYEYGQCGYRSPADQWNVQLWTHGATTTTPALQGFEGALRHAYIFRHFDVTVRIQNVMNRAWNEPPPVPTHVLVLYSCPTRVDEAMLRELGALLGPGRVRILAPESSCGKPVDDLYHAMSLLKQCLGF